MTEVGGCHMPAFVEGPEGLFDGSSRRDGVREGSDSTSGMLSGLDNDVLSYKSWVRILTGGALGTSPTMVAQVSGGRCSGPTLGHSLCEQVPTTGRATLTIPPGFRVVQIREIQLR